MAKPARSGELIGQKLGKYELLALIAVGGTAEIYLARISGASGFEKYLVVKCLLDHLASDPEFVRMFLDEARVGAQLDHSNIVQTLELGKQDGRYYLVMEHLAGMSLAQMARKTQVRGVNEGLIDTNLVLGMASQTCNGLQYAHRKTVQGKPLNLVHRDISPQNLVVSYEGILKIVDFGIAKSDMREAQTRTGTIKGKFAYMSPEQCLAKNIDSRTDIFALGSLTHELLTGRRLFKRSTTYDTYQAIVNGVVPKPSEVNPKLDANVDQVIMKALAYDREDRYPSAQSFGEAILGLLHKRSGSGSPSDISQFFEDHFHQDLTAHAEQMREFITGKRPTAKESTWDQEFATGEGSALAAVRPRAAPAVIPPKGKNPPRSLIPAIRPQPRQSAPVHLDDDYGKDDEDDGDDEEPTRIEFDPGAHMSDHLDGSIDTDGGWEAEGPTTVSSLKGSTPGLALGAAPPPQTSRPAAPRRQSSTRKMRPLPGTDPAPNQVERQTSPDFTKSANPIDVSPLPVDMRQQQQPSGHGPGGVINTLESYQGQHSGNEDDGQAKAGSLPTQLGGEGAQPVYPIYTGGTLPIAAQGSGAVINSDQQKSPYPSGDMQRQGRSGQMVPPNPAAPLSSEPFPVWMHAVAFLVCTGLGVGIVALLTMLF